MPRVTTNARGDLDKPLIDGGETRVQKLASRLLRRPLLERPVKHVLATHGGPTDRAALEYALPRS